MIVIPQNIFRLSNQKELNARGICHVWESGKVHIGFWWGNLQVIDHLEVITVYNNIKMGLKEMRWEGVDWIDLALDRDL
jgi:hypothetical protein